MVSDLATLLDDNYDFDIRPQTPDVLQALLCRAKQVQKIDNLFLSCGSLGVAIMEEAFRRVVEQIFNNWDALPKVMAQSDAGPDGKTVALNAMTNFCLDPRYEVNEETIQEELDYIMDEVFSTIFEDGSTKDIAVKLNMFLELLMTGNNAQYEIEFNSLPTMHNLAKSQMAAASTPNPVAAPIDETPENATSSEVPMEEDSSWTEVRPRRRR